MAKGYNIAVKARHRESPERLIRRFIKKVKKEKIIEQYRDRQRYEKPSRAKKIKRERAQRLRERELAKLLKKRMRRMKLQTNYKRFKEN